LCFFTGPTSSAAMPHQPARGSPIENAPVASARMLAAPSAGCEGLSCFSPAHLF
jgi:hypothetical protein